MRWWFAAIVFVLLVAWSRAWLSGRDDLELGARAEQSGNLDLALEHYEYAARWYTPLASAPQDAIDAIARIGGAATRKGERALALNAYRRLRTSILATRGLTNPFVDRLDATNRELARLTAEEQLERGGPTLRGRSRETLIADHLALLRLDPSPHRGWALVVVLSFMGWILAGFMAIRRGLDSEARVVRKPMMRWGGAAVVCFAVWIFGLFQA